MDGTHHQGDPKPNEDILDMIDYLTEHKYEDPDLIQLHLDLIWISLSGLDLIRLVGRWLKRRFYRDDSYDIR